MSKKEDDPQMGLFGGDELPELWEEHWGEMPEFEHKDLSPFKQVIVSFNNREDMAAFSKLVGQTITMKTQSIWYPAAEIGTYADKRYEDEDRRSQAGADAPVPALHTEQEQS